MGTELIISEEQEKKEILRNYRNLLRAFKGTLTRSNKKQIRLAFDISSEAHKDMRRKSGEPYIIHPLQVAQIVVKEMGLGVGSATCAILHDVVEDTELTLQDIEPVSYTHLTLPTMRTV